MRINSARDLGLYVRDRRRQLGESQLALATAANVSRRWLSDLEAGKPTAEIGLVLRTLDALGVSLVAGPKHAAAGPIDLDEHLDRIASWRAGTVAPT